MSGVRAIVLEHIKAAIAEDVVNQTHHLTKAGWTADAALRDTMVWWTRQVREAFLVAKDQLSLSDVSC